MGDYPFTVQAAVWDRLPIPVLVGQEVHGFDKLLGATLCGGSTEATKVVAANHSQSGQEKLSEHERGAHERESGAIKAVPGPEAGKAASPSQLFQRECWRDSRSRSGATLSCRRRGEDCEVVMLPFFTCSVVTQCVCKQCVLCVALGPTLPAWSPVYTFLLL